MRVRTRTALAALPLAFLLALTGCGSGDEGGDDVASVDGDAAAESAPAEELSQDEMALKFAQCLRENGVNVPDPVPGEPFMLKFGPETGADQATVQAAMEACREFNPQENGTVPDDPERDQKNLEFAECMRENGVEAFPDPQPGQKGVQITPEVGNDPDFPAAQEACQDILSGGGA